MADKFYADKGDLLYTWSASFGPHIWLGDKVIYHYHIWKVVLSEYILKDFALQILEKDKQNILSHPNGSTMIHVTKVDMENKQICIPYLAEQQKIGNFFKYLDETITLHNPMTSTPNQLFHEYYSNWLTIYKVGSVREVTLKKYRLTEQWVKKLIPELQLCNFDRVAYQQLINDYAAEHERQTTMDFHHQLKGAIIDAVDDGLIPHDPTRKVIIKGKAPAAKKKKYLSRYELQKFISVLDLQSGLNTDWLLLLIAKTGMRFSEAIALTPSDFDFAHQTVSVSKTWDYKDQKGFQPTKNKSSVRKVRLDWQTVIQFFTLIKDLPHDKPIFVGEDKRIFNSTVNDALRRRCASAGIPAITIHGLRHTHASRRSLALRRGSATQASTPRRRPTFTSSRSLRTRTLI